MVWVAFLPFRLGILWEVAGVVYLPLAGRFMFMSVQFSALFYSLLREFVMGSLGARDFSGWTGYVIPRSPSVQIFLVLADLDG